MVHDAILHDAEAIAGEATLAGLLKDRLLRELEVASQEPREIYSGNKLSQKAQQLEVELEQQRREDVQRVQQSIRTALRLANEDGVRESNEDLEAVDWLRRACGILPRLGLCSLVTALMAHHKSVSHLTLREVLPTSLGEKEMAKLETQMGRRQQALGVCRWGAASWINEQQGMLYTVRVGQVARAQQSLEQLFEEKRKPNGELAASLQARAAGGPKCVSTDCVIAVSTAQSRDVVFDPRLLVFEFLCNIMLRKSQAQYPESEVNEIWMIR
ncbi:unnamed protein product [Cladocopium goreaui]|uniref:Ubiquitinyl hydrolase 1 n=1 Tax=Cladocopium goreaui TaxID=2562237 RepID=A0A9P1BML9_9DINO|nr:unnamed protein product [Cladocopium goreaui]